MDFKVIFTPLLEAERRYSFSCFLFFDTFKAEKEIELELFALLIESPGMSGASSQIFLTINDEQVKTNKEQSFGRQTKDPKPISMPLTTVQRKNHCYYIEITIIEKLCDVSSLSSDMQFQIQISSSAWSLGGAGIILAHAWRYNQYMIMH